MPTRKVAADLADVGPAIAWADNQLLEAGVAEDVRLDVQVCVEEALANLILHGVAPSDDKRIGIAVSVDGSQASVRITDACTPFDPTSGTLPAAPTLNDALLGGHGLRLIRRLTQRLTYASDGTTNELTLVFDLRTTGAP